MTLESEWEKFKKSITDDDNKDGRRCFFAGALAVLSELPNLYPIESLPKEFLIDKSSTFQQISEWDLEITKAMEN